MSIEGIYRAACKNLFKEVHWEKFEKSLGDYKGLMLFIGGEVPKFELLRTPATDFQRHET